MKDVKHNLQSDREPSPLKKLHCDFFLMSFRALVLGGSGGVGSFAVQLLKSWGVEVTATCSTNAIDMVKDLGADYVLDYKSQDIIINLKGIRGQVRINSFRATITKAFLEKFSKCIFPSKVVESKN
jgi:NADPH:quinone reductase-like Zn-dependent oxidoreductase